MEVFHDGIAYKWPAQMQRSVYLIIVSIYRHADLTCESLAWHDLRSASVSYSSMVRAFVICMPDAAHASKRERGCAPKSTHCRLVLRTAWSRPSGPALLLVPAPFLLLLCLLLGRCHARVCSTCSSTLNLVGIHICTHTYTHPHGQVAMPGIPEA